MGGQVESRQINGKEWVRRWKVHVLGLVASTVSFFDQARQDANRGILQGFSKAERKPSECHTMQHSLQVSKLPGFYRKVVDEDYVIY